jgi:hypothetical protein
MIIKDCRSGLAACGAVVGDGVGELISWAIPCFEVTGEASVDGGLKVLFDSFFATIVGPKNWEGVL